MEFYVVFSVGNLYRITLGFNHRYGLKAISTTKLKMLPIWRCTPATMKINSEGRSTENKELIRKMKKQTCFNMF